jgi:hypothetical protein
MTLCLNDFIPALAPRTFPSGNSRDNRALSYNFINPERFGSLQELFRDTSIAIGV